MMACKVDAPPVQANARSMWFQQTMMYRPPPPTLAVRPLAFPSHTLSSVLSYNHSIVHTAYSNYMNNKDNDDLKQNHLWIWILFDVRCDKWQKKKTTQIWLWLLAGDLSWILSSHSLLPMLLWWLRKNRHWVERLNWIKWILEAAAYRLPSSE